MKLIFIYGPPASGKLTIASKLSEVTNIPLFHNHLSRDLVGDIYKDKLMDNYELVNQIRRDVMDYCSKNNTDLIFTYVYENEESDHEMVKEMVDIIESNGGVVKFVELTADRNDLISRVDNQSRKQFKKLTDPEKMTELTEDMSKFSISGIDSVKIDTSKLSPDQAVDKIVQEFKLK